MTLVKHTVPLGNFVRRRRRRDLAAFLLFIAPALIWFGTFMIWPIIRMFVNSTLRWDGIVAPRSFTGLRNYVVLLSDYHFHNALRNDAIRLVATMLLLFPPAIFIGFFLSLKLRGYRFLRPLFFSPGMMSVAAAALMYIGVFMPGGILDFLLQKMGLGGFVHFWLGEPGTALGAVIAVNLFGGIGYNSVLIAAAFGNVPTELYEAARLDGASLWTVLWRIAVPMVLEFLGVLITLQFLWVLVGSAQQVLLLTQGGPGDHTLTLSYYSYSLAFGGQRLGYSQAIGVIVFFIGIVGMLVIRAITRRDYMG